MICIIKKLFFALQANYIDFSDFFYLSLMKIKGLPNEAGSAAGNSYDRDFMAKSTT